MTKDITFHYTNPEMVKYLLEIAKIDNNASILDTGSGKNKIWYNLLSNKEKYECEIEDGVDFIKDWNKKVDWCIGNPPFHIGWQFIEKSLEIANFGIAFLGNLNFFNSLTPRRIKLMQQKGFYLKKIEVVSDKRWFGRYYFLIFTKEENNFLNANIKTF
jgi:16S rRNA A1518/A1519 N6-dimethyltransferase RsmA/KsgA/DIM1 with predicted DNA glycosylase/AP lyase activity